MIKTTGAFALFILLAALPAVAHDDGDAGGKGPDEKKDPKVFVAKMVDGMTKHLSLNDDQKGKLQAILEQSMPERLELEKKIHKLERDTNEKIRALLDDDQKEKFDMWKMHQMQKHMMMHSGRPGMRGGKPGGPDGGEEGSPGGDQRGGPRGGPGGGDRDGDDKGGGDD